MGSHWVLPGSHWALLGSSGLAGLVGFLLGATLAAEEERVAPRHIVGCAACVVHCHVPAAQAYGARALAQLVLQHRPAPRQLGSLSRGQALVCFREGGEG